MMDKRAARAPQTIATSLCARIQSRYVCNVHKQQASLKSAPA
jgi:hypothetical protein